MSDLLQRSAARAAKYREENPGDPYWDQVVLSIDGNTTITDKKGHSITPLGTAEVSTTQKMFGSGSIYFNSAGSRLSIPNSVDFNFGTGDFTTEGFVRPVNMGTNYGVLFCNWKDGGPAGLLILLPNSVDKHIYFQYSTDGSNYPWVRFPWNPVLDTWYHVAVLRRGTDVLAFVDGVQVGTLQSIGAVNIYHPSGTPVSIGGSDVGNCYGWNTSYQDDIRITKGIARYTTNFTPPTRAFPRN